LTPLDISGLVAKLSLLTLTMEALLTFGVGSINDSQPWTMEESTVFSISAIEFFLAGTKAWFYENWPTGH
jgi:hypothetical protein